MITVKELQSIIEELELEYSSVSFDLWNLTRGDTIDRNVKTIQTNFVVEENEDVNKHFKVRCVEQEDCLVIKCVESVLIRKKSVDMDTFLRNTK